MADWVFQANPKRYDVHAAVGKSRRDWWSTPRYRDRIALGDRVWLQIVGPSHPGIYYVATIVSLPYEQANAEFGRWYADIQWDYRIEPPLLRPELLADPGLKSFRPFRGFQERMPPLPREVASRLAELAAPRLVPFGRDEHPAAPRELAVSAAIEGHNARREASQHSPTDVSTKVKQTLFKGWRPLAFLLIAAVATLTGLYFKALSEPGAESKQFASQPPQIMDAFVNNPLISVHISADVVQRPSLTSADLTYELTVHIPAFSKASVVLILSNRAPSTEMGFAFHRLTPPPLKRIRAGGPQELGGYYAAEIPIHGQGKHSGTLEEFFAAFSTPAVIEETNSATYGHLPYVGSIQLPPLQVPVLGEEYANRRSLRDIVPYPVSNKSDWWRPSAYNTPYGGRATLFWYPEGYSITETLFDAVPYFGHEPLNYITPPGQFIGESYVWRSATELEPTFESTDQGASQTESNDAFLSGILFGVAGAATIALVQEVPETFSLPAWWPLGKRRRKLPPLDSDDLLQDRRPTQ